MVRPSFTTEFLLRELLAALGAPMEASAADSLPADSFSEEMSEESESQTPLPAANGRVMMVRRTNSAQHTVTLVDRHFDVEAFIPRHVIGSLQQTRGYNTLGRLRGSVVRVDKYYFATLSRCLSMDEQSSQNSVSRPAITKTSARVYLWVDALSVVDDNELAVNPQPDVYSNVLVKERLQQLTDAELEKVLMAQQSLPAVGGDAEAGGHFGDDRPLMEEDCVISADQEQELEEQEGWGPQATGERQPTDSELIEENGCVSMSQSQVFGETQSQTHRPLPVDLSATLTEPLSQTQCSVSADLSATLSESVDVTPTLDSQKYPFQQENIRETFVIDSGSDTENEEDDEDAEESDEATKKVEQNRVATSLSPQDPARSQQQLPESDTQMPAEGQAGGFKGLMQRIASNFGFAASYTDSSHPDVEPATEVEEFEKRSHHAQTDSSDDEQTQTQQDNFMSSQATAILEYSVGDDDANAFEYDGGVQSDDVASPTHASPKRGQTTGVEGNSAAVSKSSSDNESDAAVTPSKEVASPQTQVNANEFKTPSPASIRTATPGTERRVTPVSRSIPTPSMGVPARDSNPASSNAHERAESESSTTTLSSSRSPPKAVILAEHAADNSSQQQAAGSSSSALTRGSKRPRQPPTTSTSQQESPSRTPRPQRNTNEEFASTRAHKRHRKEEFTRTTSSPSIERPDASGLSLRGRRSERGDANITGPYSLSTLCQSLGSTTRDQLSDHDQSRSSRQPSRHPRRNWKRYENLFPPLNMDRLKRMMIEGME